VNTSVHLIDSSDSFNDLRNNRCSPDELARLKKGYVLLCEKSKSKKGVDKGVFIREVLGATIPAQLAAHLVRYLSRRTASGPSLATPTPPSPVSSLNFKGFLCGIVLLSKGTIEEKTRCKLLLLNK